MFPECPWCLEQDAFVLTTVAHNKAIKCDNCGLTSPMFHREEAALSCWNEICDWESIYSDQKARIMLEAIK